MMGVLSVHRVSCEHLSFCEMLEVFPLSLVAKVSQVCPVNLCSLVGLSAGFCKS